MNRNRLIPPDPDWEARLFWAASVMLAIAACAIVWAAYNMDKLGAMP